MRIDEILHFVWDPIGVSKNGFPNARDEYSSYVAEIEKAIQDGATESDIVKLLDGIQIDRMGLSSDLANCSRVAAAIFAWIDYLAR